MLDDEAREDTSERRVREAERSGELTSCTSNFELSARLGALRGGGTLDNLAIKVADDTSSTQVRDALDLTTPVHDLLDLTEEVTAGIKFADCIPPWLADSVTLARLTDPDTVSTTASSPIAEGHLAN